MSSFPATKFERQISNVQMIIHYLLVLFFAMPL